MTQPGVGPITSLAFVLTMGDVARFPRGKQVASYLGLIPREHSSGGHSGWAAISKQGNRFSAHVAGGSGADRGALRSGVFARVSAPLPQKPKGVAKVAAARKLAVRLYWMLRTQKPYPEIVRIESSPRVALVGAS